MSRLLACFVSPPDDIQAAIAYIEAHKAEVLTEYQQILARHSQAQLTPEMQEKLAHSHQKLQVKLAELRARQAKDTHASDHGGS